MTLTSRGKKVAAAVAAVGIGLGAPAVLLASGKAPEPLRRIAQDIGVVPEDPPTCPLTGVEAPGGKVPQRPALAIKVEESPDARPQAGLAAADLVYEQPVEGNITRLIAVFHCDRAARVGPVRSARFMDANLLPELGTPLFAYAGGAAATKRRVQEADLVDLSYLSEEAMDAYERDPDRAAPHNLYASTSALWKATRRGGTPEAIFAFDEEVSLGKRATVIDLPFNDSYAHVSWRWVPAEQAWARSIGGAPAVLEDGQRVLGENVIVQEIRQSPTSIVDAHGSTSYEVEVIGEGRAYVFRDGRMIRARWSKTSATSRTVFETMGGEPIALSPGTTWVELFGGQTNELRFVPTKPRG